MSSMSNLHNENCPDRESVLSVVEGGNVSSAQAGEILHHLANCAECRQAVSFVCAAAASEKRRKRGKVDPCWKRVISAIDVWGRRTDDELTDAMAAEAPRRVLVFASKPQSGCMSVWRAEVHLPAPDDPNGTLQIVVQDDAGHPLGGRFCLCGVECEIQEGKTATISVKEFGANHSTGGVAFAESGQSFVEGVPVMGSML